ncbi:Peptidase family M23 [Micromonospora coxensis]|uniref:Peptidase family M23 n=1 Tax=Micromonospora coxensis TaxID=356852 RepID=A0A1C5JIW3_9ACTN|nr:Peptidase family M23 [Micromonospora coxensis]
MWWASLLVLGTIGTPALAGGEAPVATTQTAARAAGAATPGVASAVSLPGVTATTGSPAGAGLPQFRWPLDGTPRPVRRFDPPPQPWLPGHRGVDLAAAPGATVRAAGPGTVLFAGMVAGRPVVTVGHAAGLRTTYEPVRPDVRPGDRVPAGAPLGVLLSGHPACPAAGCLHWGLRRGPEYLDPLALLGLGRVRLLPVAHGSATPSPAGPGTGGLVAPVPILTPSSGGPGVGGPAAPAPPTVSPDPWAGVAQRRVGSACRCGHRGERAGSAPVEQPRQSDRQPLVLVGGVVDLSAEP